MRRYKKGEIDLFDTITGIIFFIFAILAIFFVFTGAFSQCQASIIDQDGRDIYKKLPALLRAQDKQVMIWAVKNTENNKNEDIFTVAGLGIIAGNRKVITSKKIFDKFLKEPFNFFAVRSDFYWVSAEDLINKNIISWIENVELYEDIAIITIIDKSGLFTKTQSEFYLPIKKSHKSGDDIFILGDHNNAKAIEKIKGKIIISSHENFVIEFFSEDNSIIDRQVALGATVWDAHGNFIGFLTERVGSTNRVHLTLLN